jgi:hypothetical protein
VILFFNIVRLIVEFTSSVHTSDLSLSGFTDDEDEDATNKTSLDSGEKKKVLIKKVNSMIRATLNG